ncbi:hypothetical protein KUCAC02_009380, partial [Chaenocephalus aceratus]
KTPSPRGWRERASLICAKLLWLVLHRVVFDESGEGWEGFASSTSVPHGVLSASDCQSVRPCGAHAALQGSLLSLRRPPQLLLLRHPACCSASKAP